MRRLCARFLGDLYVAGVVRGETVAALAIGEVLRVPKGTATATAAKDDSYVCKLVSLGILSCFICH